MSRGGGASSGIGGGAASSGIGGGAAGGGAKPSWDQPIDLTVPAKDSQSQWWPAGEPVDPREREATWAHFRQRRRRTRIKRGMLLGSVVSFVIALIAGLLIDMVRHARQTDYVAQFGRGSNQVVTLVFTLLALGFLATYLVLRSRWREVHEMSQDYIDEHWSDRSVQKWRQDLFTGERGVGIGYPTKLEERKDKN